MGIPILHFGWGNDALSRRSVAPLLQDSIYNGSGTPGSARYAGMVRYRCLICGCIYDEEKGDPAQGVKPGTRFKDLPPDYRCRTCFAYVTAGGRKPYRRLVE